MEDKRKYNGRKKGSSNEIQGELKDKIQSPNSSKANFKDESTLATKEFLKVREGESQEDWEKRTQKKRIHGKGKNNNIRGAKNGKLWISRRPAKGRLGELKLGIEVRYFERPHDFLKMYSFVMRWASVRFGIVKDDIELGYYFYEGHPFTKEEFEAVCTQLGAIRGVFSRFVKKEYVTNISIMSSEGFVKETEYYQLSNKFNNALKRVYGLISKTSPANNKERHNKEKMNPELKRIIDSMNDEIIEILSKEKK